MYLYALKGSLSHVGFRDAGCRSKLAHRLQSSSFLGFPYRTLNINHINHKKEL